VILTLEKKHSNTENTDFPFNSICLWIQVHNLLHHVVLWAKALVCITGLSYL